MKIIHIYHSGFWVELEEQILIFDYYQGALKKPAVQKKVYFFSSHVHQDHFQFEIFRAAKAMTQEACFILSNDIHKKYGRRYFEKKGVSQEQYQNIVFVKPHEDIRAGDLRIRTLDSTDQGVAFLVDTPEGVIYHAGDLNWWSFEGETQQEAASIIEQKFKREIARLSGILIDAAFMTLDGRQGERFYLGFDYFMRHTNTKKVYPMHYWDDSSVIERLKELEESAPYRDRIETGNISL